MGAKKLSDADKAQAVLDLLQGKGTMAEICNRYGISPTYLYKLRTRGPGRSQGGSGRRGEAGYGSWSWNSTALNSSSVTKS
jgi:transposase-like protein